MIALIVIGIVAVVAIAVVWSRVGLSRSEKHSMESYEHRLQVLGSLAKRGDASSKVTPISTEDASRAHIRPEPGAVTPAAPWNEKGAARKPPSRKAPAAKKKSFTPPSAPRKARIEEVSLPPVFADDSDALERLREKEAAEAVLPYSSAAATSKTPAVAPTAEQREAADLPSGPVERSRPVSNRPATRTRPSGAGGHPYGRRRLAAVAAAVVVAAGCSVAGLELTSGGRQPTASGGTVPLTTKPKVKPTVPSSTTPHSLVPVSTSPEEVAFVAPKGSYTVLLTDSGGTCWVGIQQVANGPYVWQETLYDGESAHYKANGPLVVRIGAPKYLGVKVNGVPARLPGFVQPYDLVFNPANPPSSA